jgi:inhibitor of cysteine peptidase
MEEIVVSEKNNGGTLAAKVGDTLTVEVPENPTTGFRWAPANLDTSIVELRTDEFRPGGNTAVGAGGVRVFQFIVKAPGRTRLQLKLARAWEPGASSTLFEVSLDVGTSR